MTAICTNCGALEHWRASRGSHQPVLCRACNGPMARATMDKDGNYHQAVTRRPTGRKLGACALCGRVGYTGARLRVLKRPEEFLVFPAGTRRRALITGELVCWCHESYETLVGKGLGRDPYPVRCQVVREGE